MEKAYCPICDAKQDYIVNVEKVSREVKGETFTLSVKVARCITCGEEVYVSDVEQESQDLFFDAYRKAHDFPSIEDIVRMRKKLGVTQRDFSRLLGFGEITISRYESGSLPNSNNAAIIQSLFDNNNLENLFKRNNNQLSDSAVESINQYLKINMVDYLNGNTRYDIEKFHQLVYQFAEIAKEHEEILYPTKLNKLMFYTDFNHFRKYQKGITGSHYMKFSYGPVPNYFEFKYDSNPYIVMSRNEDKTIISVKEKPINNVLSMQELAIAKAVYSNFVDCNSTVISDLSHEEEAWINAEYGKPITYYYASDLKIKV